MSIMLPNIYEEIMLREALEGNADGIAVGEELIHVHRFADDQALLSHTNVGL